MARLNEIEKNNLTEKVIKLSSTKSAREIVEILSNENQVNISHTTIAKYIKEIRQDRQEATKAAIAETVTPGLTVDLEFFDEMLETYRELFRSYSGKETDKDKKLGLGGEKLRDAPKVDPISLISIGKEYRATVETKVKISGGDSSLGKLSNEDLIKLIQG
jgi:hypothetical protein